MKSRQEGGRRPPRSVVRIGRVMEAVMIYLALNGASFPWEIHSVVGHRNASVYKAVTRLYEWGWINRVQDPTHESPDSAIGQRAYRHYYTLTQEGWLNMEYWLVSQGRWTRELIASRERARSPHPASAVMGGVGGHSSSGV